MPQDGRVEVLAGPGEDWWGRRPGESDGEWRPAGGRGGRGGREQGPAGPVADLEAGWGARELHLPLAALAEQEGSLQAEVGQTVSPRRAGRRGDHFQKRLGEDGERDDGGSLQLVIGQVGVGGEREQTLFHRPLRWQ